MALTPLPKLTMRTIFFQLPASSTSRCKVFSQQHLPALTLQIRFENLLAITRAAEHLGAKLEIHRIKQACPCDTLPMLFMETFICLKYLRAITPWAAVIVSERGREFRGGGSPTMGGDLISKISLSLTKLSVKQSLVGNRAGGGGHGDWLCD